jgi:hypothetical protein
VIVSLSMSYLLCQNMLELTTVEQEVCVLIRMHNALRMFIMQVLATQLRKVKKKQAPLSHYRHPSSINLRVLISSAAKYGQTCRLVKMKFALASAIECVLHRGVNIKYGWGVFHENQTDQLLICEFIPTTVQTTNNWFIWKIYNVFYSCDIYNGL